MIYVVMAWGASEFGYVPYVIGHFTDSPEKLTQEDLIMRCIDAANGLIQIDFDKQDESGNEIHVDQVHINDAAMRVTMENGEFILKITIQCTLIYDNKSQREANLRFTIVQSKKLS